MVEKYIPRVKLDNSYSDSLYLFYVKKDNHFDFSFSKKLEQLKKMTLVKVVMIYNSSGGQVDSIPRREYVFETKDTLVIKDEFLRIANKIRNK